MRVKLTPDERSLAEKVIGSLERNGRRGPVSQSILLLIGIGHLALGVLLLCIFASPKVQSLPAISALGDDDAEVTYGSLRAILETHANMTLLQAGIVTMAFIGFASAISVVTTAMLLRRKGRRDALQARILRAALQQAVAEAPSSDPAD